MEKKWKADSREMGEKVMKENERGGKNLRVTTCNAINPSKPSCNYRYV